MLKDCALIAFVPVSDLLRARGFYVDRLGLTFETEDGFALVVRSRGQMLRLVQVARVVPAAYTVAGWEVPDIAQAVTELSAKGVDFKQYGWPSQDDSGIWTAPGGDRVAWFHDPDCNVLSLSQHTRS